MPEYKKYGRLYKIWHGMHSRCENNKNTGYTRYGARGIRVTAGWDDFSVFAEWSETHGYARHLTIERIDNDGNYEPGNCRWATRKEQARNRSHNVRIQRNGVVRCLSEWAEIEGIEYSLLLGRLQRGWGIEKALKAPPLEKDAPIAAFGRTQRLSEWAAEVGVPKDRIYLRLKRGWKPERALLAEPPKKARSKTLIEIGGESRSVADWCETIGISEATFHKRRRDGVDVLAPRGPTGPRPGATYRGKPGPRPREARA